MTIARGRLQREAAPGDCAGTVDDRGEGFWGVHPRGGQHPLSTPSDQHTPTASEAYELEVVKVPFLKRVIGAAITLVVGMSSGQGVPYRNTKLVVRDRSTGEVVGTVVPYQADITDEVAEAQRSWAEDSKAEFDQRWLYLPD